MMRRRAVPARRGPGLVGTVARTAVVAGTATATAKMVGGAMDSTAQRKQDAQYQQAMADQQAQQAQVDVQQLQAQVAQLQAQQLQPHLGAQPQPMPQAQPVPQAGGTDLLAQLQQLQQLKEAGALTDTEFAAAKAKLLAG
jgi:putative oligomerization/nucleic acid binding protein